MRVIAWVVVLATVVVAMATAGGAAAHRNVCHVRHNCPSDDHSYLWHGWAQWFGVGETVWRRGWYTCGNSTPQIPLTATNGWWTVFHATPQKPRGIHAAWAYKQFWYCRRIKR